MPDEMIGFPAIFMQAGVPGVIGTLWPAQDMPTALLRIKFYEFHFIDYYKHLNQGGGIERLILHRSSYTELLTRLSTFMLDDPDDQPFKDAAYAWAPFLCMGV